jgi:glutamate formiminotransferase
MRLLAVPNWSFGRNRPLLNTFREALSAAPVVLHYCESDADHNRTVTAFSGNGEAVLRVLLDLCALAFPVLDLTRHMGVHPRIGALDVCPFIQLDGNVLDALAAAEMAAQKIASAFDVPIFLYEKSERGRHEADLPTLRRGGFGSLLGRELDVDFGPRFAHPQLGATVLGVRDFLIAFNVNFEGEDLSFTRTAAKEMRVLRAEGDERFLGVRAMGFCLASRGQVQLSVNSTLPDLTFVDPIVEWALDQSKFAGMPFVATELIGVIRPRDLLGASRLSVKSHQVVS